MKGGARLINNTKTSGLNEPLVSIITVTYNAEKYLEQTINSVLSQSYKNIEYIIIDGGSKDKTIDIIRKFEEQIDLWISEPDGGIYFAMNKGIALAKGDIIGILNADDYYFEHSVKTIVEANKSVDADVYHGDMLSIDEISNKEERILPDDSKMYEKPSIFHPTCFVKNNVYKKIGNFDTRFKISSDYEFLLRCKKNKLVFNYVPQLITAFRVGGMSASCYSNVEGYKIMKMYNTGYQNQVIWRGIKCYIKTFIKKIIKFKK
ncbi:MAG: glycosyltransferase family 2 protein [Bacteroidota bacterium]|nr:glycosyltransferase family 2 protein [Bacteroidota bacterium]